MDNGSEETEAAHEHNTYGTSEEERAKIKENQIRENDLKESQNFRDIELYCSMMRDISHAGSARRNHETWQSMRFILCWL